MHLKLTAFILPIVALYRQYVHGYAWTSELHWLNWIIIIVSTILLYKLGKKEGYLTFLIVSSSWVIESVVSNYFLLLPLLLMLYLYKNKAESYILYPIISVFNPPLALTSALLHTYLSKGKKVYTIALACTGYVFSYQITPMLKSLPSVYIIIAILAFTSLLLKHLNTFIITVIPLTIGIIIKDPVMVYASTFYTISFYLSNLHKEKWTLPELKQISILAIVTGILFVSITTSVTLIDSEPHKDTLSVLQNLNGTILLLPEHELAARITKTDYLIVHNLTLPSTDNVQQLLNDGFLINNNIYEIPYTKIIVEAMIQNNVSYILHDVNNHKYKQGINRALISEDFILVRSEPSIQVYTYVI